MAWREPFDSPDWIFELKWGGVRALCFIDNGTVEVRGQNGSDITGSYPEVQQVARQVDAESAVLDGEIAAVGLHGYPKPELLRQRLHRPPQTPVLERASSGFCYQVTDLLAIGDDLLVDNPLWVRKNLLHECLRPSPAVQASAFVDADGEAFFNAVCEHRLPGVIAKQKFSPYLPGQRSANWLEIPAVEIGYFIVGGYTFGGGQRKTPFEHLLLGAYRGPDLVFAGRAGAVLSETEGWRVVTLLEDRVSPNCPFVNPPEVNRFSHWCRPELVCQVRIGERAADSSLRFASFTALRPDLSPRDCLLEAPGPPS